MTLDPGQAGEIGVVLHYDAAGRLTQTDYSNGTYEFREYDEANRLTAVRHGPSLQSPLYEIEYTWTRNNWVQSRREIDHTVNPATDTTVAFTYDNRGRLERHLPCQALERTGDNQSKAAKLLNLSRDRLRYRLQKHGLL